MCRSVGCLFFSQNCRISCVHMGYVCTTMILTRFTSSLFLDTHSLRRGGWSVSSLYAMSCVSTRVWLQWWGKKNDQNVLKHKQTFIKRHSLLSIVGSGMAPYVGFWCEREGRPKRTTHIPNCLCVGTQDVDTTFPIVNWQWECNTFAIVVINSRKGKIVGSESFWLRVTKTNKGS